MVNCPNCDKVVSDSDEHYYESGSGMGHYNCHRKKIKRVAEKGQCPSCYKDVKDPLEHYYESGSGMGHYRC